MKFGIRLWILAIFLTFSILSIVNILPTAKLMLLGLAIASLFAITSIKSKPGKIIIVLILILAAGFLIYQQTIDGVVIKSVEIDSPAYEQGLRQGQILISVNEQPVETIAEYTRIIGQEFPNALTDYKKITLTTTEGSYLIYTNSAPEIILNEIPLTNIKLGLDLQGGSRALIKAKDQKLSQQELTDLIAITNNRLNVYGLSDMVIKSVSDGLGEDANNYMLIEIAGATPTELEDLISKQGKFEAKIANQTVFTGGEGIHVERAGQFAGIESCVDAQEGVVCKFRFPITLSAEYAKNHAEITSKLDISLENPQYLSEQLELYVDGTLTDALYISKDLKGQEATQISISGSGIGSTKQEALDDAQLNMNKLQTILITGSLPYKLEIVKLDTISPTLGKKFIKNIFLAGLASLLAVALIVLLRYRKLKLPLALLLTSFSEILIILGIAAMLSRMWSLDLPAIAGIIAVIGTGVDQQIVVLDESRSGTSLSIKQRLKRAAAIILGSYLTTLGAMLPLMWSGAGLLRGFAIATIVGISVGVFITRPAFAEIVRKIVD